MAFGGRISFRIDINGVIRASLHTSLAANTNAGIKVDDAIFTLVHSCDRTYAGTWWIGTVVTARDLEVAACVGVDACFYVLNPGAINTQGYLIFTFAGCGTGVATNTLAIIDNEAVVHKVFLQKGGN